jgi:phage shock protein PspC (stress-responsive transcriptional regulator)
MTPTGEEERRMETTAEEPMASAPQQVKRLVRRRQDKIIAGVAGGLGDYFGIDPIIFRIGFVVTAFTGWGIIAYLAAWLLIPEAPLPGEEAGQPLARERPQTWIGIALLVAGTALLLGQTGWWDGSVMWGIGLIGVGVLLFVQDRDRSNGPREATPPPGPTHPQPPGATYSPGATTTAPAQPPGAKAARPPRERSSLGLLTTAATLIAIGIAAFMDALDVVSLTAYQYLAIALAVMGLGLTIGAWLGRARWLIVVGIILAPFMLAASLVRIPMDTATGAGQRFFTPTSISQVKTDYELFAGEMVLDLSELPPPETSLDVRAVVGAGSLRVVVPDGVGVDVRADAGLGEVDVFGRRADGSDVTLRRVFGPSEPRLNLNLSAHVGEVRVIREPSTQPQEAQ